MTARGERTRQRLKRRRMWITARGCDRETEQHDIHVVDHLTAGLRAVDERGSKMGSTERRVRRAIAEANPSQYAAGATARCTTEPWLRACIKKDESSTRRTRVVTRRASTPHRRHRRL